MEGRAPGAGRPFIGFTLSLVSMATAVPLPGGILIEESRRGACHVSTSPG